MSKKILIVEDNKDLCEIYQIAFESKGYEVKISNNGMNAVSLVGTFSPSVVLLDIMMPFVSGFDFLKTVREKDQNLLIVVNSNLSQESDVDKAMELKANYYIRKADYTPNEVVEKIEELMKDKKKK